MTREEIIRMAYDAGMTWEGGFTRVVECVTETELTRFANLIASAERNACANLCSPYVTSLNDRVSLAALNIHKSIRNRNNQ